MRTWMAMLLITGCGGKEESETSPEGQGEVPPYITEEGATELPETTSTQVSAAVQEAITALMSIRGTPLTDAYLSATAGSDEGCPSWGSNNGDPYWIGACTSDDGTRFDGVGAIIEFDDYTDGPYTYTGQQLYAVATVITPEGHAFQGTGGASNLWGLGPSGQEIQFVSYSGDFSWDGPGSAGSWLRTGLSPNLSMSSTTDPSGWRTLNLDGTVAGISKASAIVFHDLMVISGVTADGCIPEPSGALSVRDLNGQWIDLEFDGSSTGEWPPDEAACDGCGMAWYKGLDLGPICPDFDGLRDWDGPYPWL